MLSRLQNKSGFQISLNSIRCLRWSKRPSRPGHLTRALEPDDYFLGQDETSDEISDILGQGDNRNLMLDKQPSKEAIEKLGKNFLKQRIIERKLKNMYNPKEPSLLTWAAKMQMKFLNKNDPIYWTPTMLANSFPISKDSVIKILQSDRLPINEAEISKHDSKVRKNWLKLQEVMTSVREGRINELDEDQRGLADLGKRVLHLLPHAAGNSLVTVPPSKFAFQTQEQIAEENKPVVKPYFSTILTSYDEDRIRLKQNVAGHVKPIGFEDETVLMLLQDISNGKRNSESIREDDEDIADIKDDNESNFELKLDEQTRHAKSGNYWERNLSYEGNYQNFGYRKRNVHFERFNNFQKSHPIDDLYESGFNKTQFKGVNGYRNSNRRTNRFNNNYDLDHMDEYFDGEQYEQKQRLKTGHTSTFREHSSQNSVYERVQQNFKRQTNDNFDSDDDMIEQNKRSYNSVTPNQTRRNKQRGLSRMNKTVDGSNYVGTDEPYCKVTPLFDK